MALHRLTSITMGVPRVDEVATYYEEFGLIPEAVSEGERWFATRDGGRQLHIVHAPTRRLVDVHVGVDDEDDLGRATHNLQRMGITVDRGPCWISAVERATGTRAFLEIAPRVVQDSHPGTPYNGPGRYERTGDRAPGVLRTDRVRPRKLGHAVLGTTDYAVTQGFFVDGLGFRISDHIKGAGTFMRCSTDHHNILVLSAPVPFLHHTSWQVDDIDDVGRGAHAMLEDHPERHVWGLGRHYGGSNFFWYLKDPAGNFSEYYSDMDCIVDDQLWTPQDLEGAQGLYSWGPPPPPSFLHPDDLAALMTGAHSG
ncbi:VOC family protein [Streptomyces sp. NBC_00457]|uniref:VOC family protein n=1 Tax=unclassified Streptomyces TaxID=2593676 RepID=UPI002E2203EC|nr:MULTISPECIES: VOC family protein [unclassified Streptomyces]